MAIKLKVLTKSNLDVNKLLDHEEHINDIDPHGSSRFTAEDGRHNISFDVKGSGFVYVGDIPKGGMVSRVTIDKGASHQLQIDLSPSLSVKKLVNSGIETYLEKQVIKFTGNNGADKFKSGDKSDLIKGLKGNDVLYGDSGNDKIEGGTGNDKLYGEQGNDIITGGTGRDSLYGGTGADRFVYNSLADSMVGALHDTIFDFNQTQGDKIDLRTIDAITGGANDAFTFVAAFTNVAGQLIQSGNLVQGDVNGDSIADFEIRVLNVATFTAGDFLL